ncbi:hypothetical protein EQW78_16395 [Oerskovia turbata]|uniref:Uncharacterized protein n=1 Tax=Oerskovia turbata TaxID=1713 RepID=A0A4Q1KNL5_9CELL|nr:hypothetical protein [Oerskovia turbata]RXR26059.1 hypothetical protein EQW73_06770 [Oerskovia turbata]RXR31633.1 hypothetical protein EQW78_16395 [Oerskovia turbata]TGJ97261.1 hypothetical protein DLJ96_04470 [Actinotalea fermentans ATCC 43279 = JCM 9966 = DSM 3133]
MTTGEIERRSAVSTTVGDVVRVLAGIAIPVGSLLYGLVATALLSLVLLGAVIPRAVGLKGPLDPLVGLVLSAAAWIALLDLYAQLSWLDLAVHLVATAVLTVLAYAVLVFLGALPSPGPLLDGLGGRPTRAVMDGLSRPRLGAVVTAAALGVLLALLWEVGEWAGTRFVDPAINVGYLDTLGDLVAGGIGALAAGVLLVRGS